MKMIVSLLFHISYPSGDTYEGQWKNNVRHGEGTMKWIQLGQQYSGQWLNGVQVCESPQSRVHHCHLCVVIRATVHVLCSTDRAHTHGSCGEFLALGTLSGMSIKGNLLKVCVTVKEHLSMQVEQFIPDVGRITKNTGR